MKLNGTKTTTLTIALAMICALAPLTQTMAAGGYRSRTTTGYRNVDRKNTRKTYLASNNKTSRSNKKNDGQVEEVLVTVGMMAIVAWLISDSFSNNNNSFNQDRHNQKRKRDDNSYRTRRGY